MASKKPKMMFKNMMAFRLPAGWKVSASILAEQLARCTFVTCGSQEEKTSGFVAPRGDDSASLVHAVGGQYLITLQNQSRILPASVVKEALDVKIAEVSKAQGFPAGSKQRKSLKEDVRLALLPKAFLKTSQIRAWFNPINGFLVIEAASYSKAELMLAALSKTLEKFPALRLTTQLTPAAAMFAWLSSGDAPADFSVDCDCELKSPAEEKAAVRYVRHSLDRSDVREHLAQGKQPTRLALTFNNRVSFVLTDKQEIKSLKLLDIKAETSSTASDADELFDAEFVLMSGEYTELLLGLIDALGGETEG